MPTVVGRSGVGKGDRGRGYREIALIGGILKVVRKPSIVETFWKVSMRTPSEEGDGVSCWKQERFLVM